MRNTKRYNIKQYVTPPPFLGGGWEGVVEVRDESKSLTLHTVFLSLLYSYEKTLSFLSQFTARTLPPPNLPLKKGEEFKTLRVFKIFFLVSYFLFQISYLATAQQSPYTGGSGDGHAMGELVLRQVSVNELSAENGYAIYPSLAKPNEAIYITSPTAGEFILVDLTGRTVISQTLTQPAKQLPLIVTQVGSYIGILRTEEGMFTQKIIVLE